MEDGRHGLKILYNENINVCVRSSRQARRYLSTSATCGSLFFLFMSYTFKMPFDGFIVGGNFETSDKRL